MALRGGQFGVCGVEMRDYFKKVVEGCHKVASSWNYIYRGGVLDLLAVFLHAGG